MAEDEGKNPAIIKNMVLAGDKYYIQDAKGKIFALDRDSDLISVVYRFSEGKINALVASPAHNYAVSLGESGQVKVWDYAQKISFAEKEFSGSGTCMTHLP